MKMMYVVLGIRHWKEANSISEDGSKGFLPVFETKKMAQKKYPGFDIVELGHTEARGPIQ